MKQCPKCQSTNIKSVEYAYGHPERYDGISEYCCAKCGYRQGRWSGRELDEDDYEFRFGEGIAQRVQSRKRL